MPRARVKYRKTPWPKPPGVPRARLDLGAHRLAQAARQHLEWLSVHGFSEGTVRHRRSGLTRFIRWCEARALLDAREITQPILERYQQHLFYYRQHDGRPLSVQVQARLIVPLRAWFKWLTREHHILYNPASELTLPKCPKHLPRVILSVPEIEAILSEADPSHVKGLRDRAMLETLYSTGVRRMELCNIQHHDLDFTRRTLFVREGKGKKDRVIPIGQRACAWIEKYLIESRPQLLVAEHDALFVNDYGDPIAGPWLALKIKSLMRFAGLERPGSCHLFRHACATHMLENGADTRFIQALLGHENLSTTQIYTRVSIEKLKQIHDATHPAKLTRTRDILTALVAEPDDDERADTDTDA